MEDDVMNNIYYQIQDENGNYVDKYSFQKESQGRGRKPKWYYFSETGYVSGRTLYSDTTGDIQKLLDYLTKTSEQLGLNKKFKIVPIDENTVLKFDGKIICEELNI